MFPFEKEDDKKKPANKGFDPFGSSEDEGSESPESPESESESSGSKRDKVIAVLEKHGVMDVDALADDLLDALGLETKAEEKSDEAKGEDEASEPSSKPPPKKGTNPFADKKNKLF